MAGDTFQTIYLAVQAKLKDTSAATLVRVKSEVNNAVKEICAERNDWRFMFSKNNYIAGTGAREYIIGASDFGSITDLRIGSASIIGDNTTVIGVTNPVGTTYRYTYTSGVDPHIGLLWQQVGDYFSFTGFSAGNNLTNAVVTGVGLNYVEFTNAAGVVESKSSVTITALSRNNAVPTRRTNVQATAQQARGLVQTNLVQGVTSWNTTLTDNPYSYIDLTTIQFKLPILSNQGIWYDYNKELATMTNDGDVCVIPSGSTHVIVQLAFANMMEVDDDTRAIPAFQRYQIMLKKMVAKYVYSVDIDDVGQQRGYSDA